MEARDLMPGDWVKASKDFCFFKKGDLVKVCTIDPEKSSLEYKTIGFVTCIPVDGVPGYRYGIWTDFLEPIQLTPEIMEENGFKKVPQPECAEPYHWELIKYEDNIEDYTNTLYRIEAFNTPFIGMKVYIINPSACYTIVIQKQMQFVHEFQHALKQSEIDMEIKL